MDEIEEKEQINQEIERIAVQRAKQRARASRWNLDTAIFAFAVLALIIILGFQRVRIEIVAPVAVAGLGLVWLSGWWHARRLYNQFHDEELFTLRRAIKQTDLDSEESTIEEMVQKAIRDRFK